MRDFGLIKVPILGNCTPVIPVTPENIIVPFSKLHDYVTSFPAWESYLTNLADFQENLREVEIQVSMSTIEGKDETLAVIRNSTILASAVSQNLLGTTQRFELLSIDLSLRYSQLVTTYDQVYKDSKPQRKVVFLSVLQETIQDIMEDMSNFQAYVSDASATINNLHHNTVFLQIVGRAIGEQNGLYGPAGEHVLFDFLTYIGLHVPNREELIARTIDMTVSPVPRTLIAMAYEAGAVIESLSIVGERFKKAQRSKNDSHLSYHHLKLDSTIQSFVAAVNGTVTMLNRKKDGK